MARLEGPTIVVLLPSTPLSGATVISERIRAAVESAADRGSDGEPLSTISIGAAELSQKGSLYDLLATAETALTRAKELGGNRVATNAR